MAFEIRYYNTNLNKDDFEFITEFPCLLGHPVPSLILKKLRKCFNLRDYFLMVQFLGQDTSYLEYNTSYLYRLLYIKPLVQYILSM